MSCESFRRNMWCAVLNDIRGLTVDTPVGHAPRDAVTPIPSGGAQVLLGGCCSGHSALPQCHFIRTLTFPPSNSKTSCPTATPWRERDSIQQSSSARGVGSGGSGGAAAAKAAAAVGEGEEGVDLITPVSTAPPTPEPENLPRVYEPSPGKGSAEDPAMPAMPEFMIRLTALEEIGNASAATAANAAGILQHPVVADADADAAGDDDDDAAADSPECPICFCEIESASDTWACSNPSHQHTHVACTTCVQYHIQSRVEEGMLVMSCPVDYAACSYTLTQQEVKRLARPEDVLSLEALMPKKKGGWFTRRANGSGKAGKGEREGAGGLNWKKKKTKKGQAKKPPRESFRSQLRTWWHKKWHTRQCRKCLARIEKNGGCNHMTCRCGHEICWQCGGDYVNKDGTRGHGGGGGVLDAAFPEISEWKYACHTTKLWAIRISGVAILVGVVLPLGVSVACIVLPTYGPYTLWKWSKKKWARRKEMSRHAERNLRWAAQLENEIREQTNQPCAHYYSPLGNGACYFCGQHP